MTNQGNLVAGLADFLQELTEHGAVVFREPPAPTPADRPAAERFLRALHAEAGLEIAGPPLPFQAEVALAAAELLRQACWFLVQRADEADVVAQRLTLPPPTCPADHLSADWSLRYLPQIHRRARALVPDDVLTRGTADVLRRWPLSGVLADIPDAPLTPPDFGHPGLELLYAERFAEREKVEWLPAGRGLEVVALVFQERGRTPAAPPARETA